MISLHFQNLDLFSVGAAVAGMMILGFVTFFNDSKSISNRIFLCLTTTASIWGILNYISYQISLPELAFWVLRFVMFFATWSGFFVFTFSYVFPSKKFAFSPYYKWLVIPITTATAILTLTPLVFAKIVELSVDNQIIRVNNGFGIFIFGIVIAFLNFGSIVLVIRKILKADEEERKPLKIVLLGIILMLFLIMIFNFLLPAFFENSDFIPLGAVFLLPFVVLTAYAAFRHSFLSVKVVTTEVLTFFLSVVVLYEVIFAENFALRFLRLGVFLLVLSLGILLIRSVRNEIEQRERLEKLTKELADANEKLKALDKLRSEFLSFAAHQVRSPMSVVKGYATLIYDGTYGNVSDEVKDKARKIKLSANRLIALVNNLLDMRKIEEGKMEFDFAEADIVKFVAEIAEEYKFLAEEKKLEFSFESTLSEYKMQIDEQKLRQVIQNLLDNSVKYTDKGFVKLYLTEKEEFITLAVSDSGRGMSQDLQKKLFQQFVRDEKTKLEIQGTGLGLFIAKQIVEAHHGTVTATSEGEGKGSTFTVKLRKK